MEEQLDDLYSGPPSPPYKSQQELKAMSNGELAAYLSICNHDYDGLSMTARVALVRLLKQ